MKPAIFGIPNPIKIVGGLLSGAAKTVAGSVFGELAKLVAQALNKALASLATLWVNVGTPQLATSTGGSEPSPTVAYIQGHLWFVMTAAAVVGVIAGCGRMVWEQRAEPGRDVLRGVVVFVLVSGAGLAVVSLAVDAADGFSTWIINGALAQESFGSAMTELLAISPTTGALGLLLVILMGFLGLLASVIQIMLMVVRGGMLVVLAGVLPLCASFTGTQAGRQWFRKAAGWLVAFVLYKPAAAIVYATAIRLSTSGVFGPGGLVGVVTGLALMIVALLALPALMRFVVPMVGTIAAGGAGATLGAAAAAATLAMPSGAVGLGAHGAGAMAAGAAGGGHGAAGGGGGGGDRDQPKGAGPTPNLDRSTAPPAGSTDDASAGETAAVGAPSRGSAAAVRALPVAATPALAGAAGGAAGSAAGGGATVRPGGAEGAPSGGAGSTSGTAQAATNRRVATAPARVAASGPAGASPAEPPPMQTTAGGVGTGLVGAQLAAAGAAGAVDGPGRDDSEPTGSQGR